MSYNNQITVRRHKKALAEMIFDTMRNENKSLLEAYVKVQSMVTEDDVLNQVKEMVQTYNGRDGYVCEDCKEFATKENPCSC